MEYLLIPLNVCDWVEELLNMTANSYFKQTVSSDQGADTQTAGCDNEILSKMHSLSNTDNRYIKQHSQQKASLFSNESLENHSNSKHFNGDGLVQCKPTSNIQLRMAQTDSKIESDDNILALSETLESTSMSNQPFEIPTSSPPWYELAPVPSDVENIKNPFDKPKTSTLQRNFSYLSDQAVLSKPSIGSEGIDVDVAPKIESEVNNCVGNQGKSKPRMILGANATKVVLGNVKQTGEIETDSNRKLKEMLGVCQQDGEGMKNTSSKFKTIANGQTSPTFQPGNGLPPSSNPYTNGSQLPHIQMTGNRLTTNMNQPMQQMYCVSNIVFPSSGQGHPSNLVPTSGVMTNVSSSSRLPHGMMRVPLVDMSRFVYLQPFPMNVAQTHTPNNNYNNSSSSNPHVNTSNIITINTSENDFSVNGDRSGRSGKPGYRGKALAGRARSATDEFPIPVFGMRANDDGTSTKGVKIRNNNPNPWDQDLEHDFSSTLFSKMKKMEHGNSNPDMGYVFPEMVCNQQGANSSGSSFMQWPVAADMHPEMLDMLAVKKPVDECGTSRVCWPDMEFMMPSTREQLQAVRKSNKPLGSNKANLISILPKGRTSEFCEFKHRDIPNDEKLLYNMK